MLDWWKLRQEERRLRRAERDRKKRMAGTSDPEKREEIRQSEGYEIACWYAEIEVERTKQIVRKCRRLFVPLPDPSEKSMWGKSPFSGDSYLTMAGYHQVSKLIHEARQRNFDLWGRWISALTGLGGVLIGILSILY